MTPRRVLIVDDQPHVIRVVRLGLERKGYEVGVAHDGAEALAVLAERDFDVVITDLQMPRMDGRELCEAVHRGPPDRRPLMLVVTGKTDEWLREWAAALPGTEFLEKPVSLRRLGARLDAHFEPGEVQARP